MPTESAVFLLTMRRSPIEEHWWSYLNRLPVKIGGLVAGTAVLLFAIAADLPWWGDGLAGLLIGGVTFGAVYLWGTVRLQHARSTLRQIQQHEFESLEAAAVPNGDELNALIWQIYRTGQALDEEIRELREMESYRREFVGNVSHELKTPIFSIQGFAETLLDGALDDRSVNRSFVEKILRNVNRLDRLARDLSAISRIETGEMEMEMAPFDVGRLVDEARETLEIKAQEKGIALRSEVPEDLPLVQGDRERIRQVIVNLTDNAIKYNDTGGHVTIRAALQPEGEVQLAVSDDGIGIAPEHVDRLTERFYRVDKSRSRNEGGTGLGLAIVKHILGAHKRTLQVESSPGEGSTFSFTLSTVEKESV